MTPCARHSQSIAAHQAWACQSRNGDMAQEKIVKRSGAGSPETPATANSTPVSSPLLALLIEIFRADYTASSKKLNRCS